MKQLRFSEQTAQRLARLGRFIVLAPMLLLGHQLRLYFYGVWTDHWLNKDGKTTRAFVTQTHPKRVFDYRYTVNGIEYSGTSVRDWEDEKVHELRKGEETTVYFSASHPWLSSMQSDRLTWEAIPIVVLILLFELLFLAVLLDPNGRTSVGRWLLKTQAER